MTATTPSKSGRARWIVAALAFTVLLIVGCTTGEASSVSIGGQPRPDGGVCQAGLTACADVCANLSSDNQNCGSCGNACPAGDICSNGSCALSCQAGLQNCKGTCSNPKIDPANCGACGTVCPKNQVCSAGSCTLSCDTGLTDCAGQCVSTQSDPANCGGCGKACPAGYACQGGSCVFGCDPATVQN